MISDAFFRVIPDKAVEELLESTRGTLDPDDEDVKDFYAFRDQRSRANEALAEVLRDHRDSSD
eukprot:5970430-Amphidinium_carterae.1